MSSQKKKATTTSSRGSSWVLLRVSQLVVVFAVGWSAFCHWAMLPAKSFELGVSVKGKTLIVTGANSGIGWYTAKVLAERGARVVMACRSIARCNEAKADIIKDSGKAVDFVEPEVHLLDLGSFSSIRDFSNAMAERTIDVLVNNAGLMGLPPPRSETADGIEMQFGVNHIGHFLLTALLFPLFAKGARIINHSSLAHLGAPVDFFVSGDYQTRNYTSATTWDAYGLSKLANLQFTYEINDRLAETGNPKGVVAVAIHPGYTGTMLQSKSVMATWGIDGWANKYVAMDLASGSISQILAVADPSVEASNNTFYGPRFMMFGYPAVSSTGKYHKLAQKRLWEISEELTGLKFDV